MAVDLRHGGNREALADQLGCRPDQLLDASASLAPWTPRLRRPSRQSVRDYPDRRQQRLRQAIAEFHGLKPHQVLPGNGAAELFTWAARDAARAGLNVLPAPGFADYSRALSTWQATTRHEPNSVGAAPRAIKWARWLGPCRPEAEGQRTLNADRNPWKPIENI